MAFKRADSGAAQVEGPRPARSNGSAEQKKVWIDLDNTPHIPFFAPIIEELEKRGCSVTLTARDCFQVCELADLFHLPYRRIGCHYGKKKLLKAFGTVFRGLQLLPSAWREKPNLALSHGSRSQLVAAAILGTPSLVILDYEFAKPLPGLSPTWVMTPELIPKSDIQFDKRRILKYPGIKEDVYVPGFTPDTSLKSRLGIDESAVVVTLRPPANEAHYHNPESEVLFRAVMERIGASPAVTAVLLPRNARQGEFIRRLWPDLFRRRKVIIPEHAVDGLNLIWNSDLVISGGGTMNREAAALGVQVYSIFRGKIGAVDRYLADAGRLVLLTTEENVKSKIVLRPRERSASSLPARSAALDTVVNSVIDLLEKRPSSTGVVGPSVRAEKP